SGDGVELALPVDGAQFHLGELLVLEGEFGVVGAGGKEFAALPFEALDALAEAAQHLLQVLDAGLLHLRLLAGRGGPLVEFIPAGLPEVHVFLGGLQQGGGLLLLGPQGVEGGHDLGELRPPALGPGAVAPQVLLGLGVVALGLLDVLAQFPGALANVLNGLFGTRHFGADGVELALGGVEAVALVGVAGAEFFQGVVAAAALGDQGLDVQLLAGDQGLAALQLGVELAPAQGLELGLGLALLLLEFGVLFGGLGLALEALELAPQLVADVGEALEVLLGAAHAVLGVAAALLVLGNAGGLLDE